MEAWELPAGTSRSARRRKRRRSARARVAFAEAAEGGADAAADGVPPAVVDAHRRAAKLTAVQELRRARQALDTVNLGMVSDAPAGLPVLEALHPPPALTDPEYSPAEEPPDLRRAAPSWGGNADETYLHGMWVNRCVAGRCHSRTTAFLASGTVFALHKDDPAARKERAKTGEPLRVRPLRVGSVLVRLAFPHALVHVVLERIASFGTSGYGCHHGAMRLLVVCALRQTGFFSRMMMPSELDPFLEAVDAANSLAAFSLLGLVWTLLHRARRLRSSR
eukprot:jgi/Tetstr1/433434/TSEL_022708.t1